MAKIKEIFHPKKHTGRFVVAIVILFLAAVVFIGVSGIQIWEYSNSTHFCAVICHNVHPEEPGAYADSRHAQVKCVECHMGRLGTIKSMMLKASHAKHLPATIFGAYHRPVSSESLQPASQSCERCHNAEAEHDDTVRDIRRYGLDEANTEKRLLLVLRSGGGDPAQGLADGAHWHVVNPVEYIASDEHRQEIPWVRTPDGRVFQSEGLSAQQIEDAEIHVMDCIDCHNRMGHPFTPPESALDEALADGRLDRRLPYIKKEMLQLLAAGYESQEAALNAITAFPDRYSAQYGSSAGFSAAALTEAADLANELIPRIVFEKPGITWESFPDNRGHRDFPGCFRCHDGNHAGGDGQVIPLNCVTCHNAPVGLGDQETVPISLAELPGSHRNSSFIRDHRLLAGEKCASCHGEIAYGTDDSSFCASAACHDGSWVRVDVDKDFTHPLALEARHSELSCNECHQGVVNPAPDCASCHTPPRNHLGANCESCHAPSGWAASAASIVKPSPTVPHPKTGMEQCLMCHAAAVKPVPADHHYSEEQCLICHKVSI